jgi:hypothetical protein
VLKALAASGGRLWVDLYGERSVESFETFRRGMRRANAGCAHSVGTVGFNIESIVLPLRVCVESGSRTIIDRLHPACTPCIAYAHTLGPLSSSACALNRVADHIDPLIQKSLCSSDAIGSSAAAFATGVDPAHISKQAVHRLAAPTKLIGTFDMLPSRPHRGAFSVGLRE